MHLWLRCFCASAVFTVAFAATLSAMAADGDASKVQSPLSPADAIKHFVSPDGYRVEIVASEPDIADPVAARFDEDGRLWVAEMRDYPDGWPDGPPPKSRIIMLEDRDDDGRYETSHVFADKLPFATGVQPWKGGVIVTAAGKVMYMKDTNGDGRTDVQETWYSGFAEDNPQHRVNHPRFALDNRIYVAVGSRGAAIKSSRTPNAEPLNVSGRDFRFDPNGTAAEAVTGPGQFGVTFDDFGNRFEVSNRNPMYHLVLAERYLTRNPLLTISDVKQDVAASGEASHVFPISQSWTTSILHAGQFTAACGVDVYRGDALRDCYGNGFTCEPTGNLVHREIVSSTGGSFTAKPAYEGKEFLASDDAWFRPVNIDGGPDGALYVVDMYRCVIEHPQYMPAELKQRPDLRYGEDKGRVWRVTSAEKTKREKPKLSQSSTAELVKLFEHPSGWWRDTASRLIYERQDRSIAPDLVKMAQSGATPVARVLALWALNGLGLTDDKQLTASLADASPRVREQAIVLAEPLAERPIEFQRAVQKLSGDGDARLRFQVALSLGSSKLDNTAEALAAIALVGSGDIWTRRAVATATPDLVAAALSLVLARLSAPSTSGGDNDLALVDELARIVGASRDTKWISTQLRSIDPNSGRKAPEGLALALVNGLAQGARSRGTTVVDLVAADSADGNDLKRIVEHWFARSADIVADASREAADRNEACNLLAYAPFELASPTLLKLLDTDPSQDVRRRALSALASQRDPRVGPLVIERMGTATPGLRSAMLDALLLDTTRCNLLLDEIAAGRIKAGELGVLRAGRIVKHRDKDVQKRGNELLASAMPADRAKALTDYQEVLAITADAAHGKEVFRKNCSTCHRIGDVGVDVGPSIADSRVKTPDQLLVDILQPSKAIDNNFMSYSVTTVDGQGYTGVIVAETATSVTMKLPEAKTVALLRSDIDELRPNGISLMPDGLEKNISKQDMADVIAFVKNWRYLTSGVPASTVPSPTTSTTN